MNNNQGYLFIVFTLNGILIGIIFDLFRILRKSFKTNDIVTYIQDICFWIITGITILSSMYIFSDGELRLFMIIGLIIGTLIYILTISKYVIKISVFIINILKKIIIFPLKIIFRPISFIYNKTINFINKKIKKKIKIVKNIRKKREFFKKWRKIII